MNRHQHLVTVAQAWVIDGDPKWLAVLQLHMESWWAQNPPQCGINWASALEVAFRALSWLWILHWTHDALPVPFRRKLLNSLYLHGRHLEASLSVYFSPNTHLLGEAVALHAVGMALGQNTWCAIGNRIVQEELQRQVLPDGAHFEQSSYYHVYTLDMFLLHAVLRGERHDPWRDTLLRMAGYLQELLSPDWMIPLFGDDDGGRLFHPYGLRRGFGAASLAACLSWLGEPAVPVPAQAWNEFGLWLLGSPPPVASPPSPVPSVRHFPSSGLLVWRWPDGVFYLDGGGFGALSAGHSHADALSVVLRYRASDVLLDPGTFSYMSAERNAFRTSQAHNTVHVEPGQAEPSGPFSWRSRPEVQLTASPDAHRATGFCRSAGAVHYRHICVQNNRFIWILDTVSGAAGMAVSQNWHTATLPVQSPGGAYRLTGGVTIAFAGGDIAIEEASYSQVYAGRQSCWRIRQYTTPRPSSSQWAAAAVLDLEGSVESIMELKTGPAGFELEWAGQRCTFNTTV